MRNAWDAENSVSARVGEDETPAGPCPSGGTWARRWWPSRSHVCPAVQEVTARAGRLPSHLDVAAGARWTVAVIILSTVMELTFEDKTLTDFEDFVSRRAFLEQTCFYCAAGINAISRGIKHGP